MSRLISDILDSNRVEFKNLVDYWESKSGSHSHDIHIYSEMRRRSIKAIKELGLDPTDTISGELYFALQARANQDNQWLESYLKTNQKDKPSEHIKKLSSWVAKNSLTKDVWSLKPAKIKTFIKKTPPKLLMKTLGLRSVDSMLKRSSVTEILSLAYEVESEEWKNKFRQNYKKLKITDFDLNKVDIKILERSKIDRLKKVNFDESKIIIPNTETGGILIIEPNSRFPLDTLAIVTTLSECISDLRRHSAYLRTLSVNKNFGQKFYDVCTRGIIGASTDTSEIGWNSIHKHLVGNEDFFNKIQQPYITYDEFALEPAVSFLSKHDPRFEFWKDLEFVFFNDKNGSSVSMNLIDVVANGSNKLPYSKSTKIYGKSRLWEEIWARYLTSDNVAEEVVDSFLK